MSIKEFSNLLSDSSTAICAYNGFGKLKIFAEIGGVTQMIKVSVEGGEIPWTGKASKEILQHINQTIGQDSGFIFDPATKIVATDRELFHSSDEYEIPSFNPSDNQIAEIATISLITKEWKAINKFGAIAKDKVYIQVTGNILSLSAIAPDGLIVTNTVVLEHPLQDEQSINFSIPKQALFEAESVAIEIGSEKILIESSDRASIWTINIDEPAFFPGLIPEGAIEIGIARKDLNPLLEKGGSVKININKNKGVQLKSTNGKQMLIQIDISCDVPPRTSFQVMAEALESAIKLIGTAKLITLALPVGLQYIAVSAAAVRCLLPTVVGAAKALTAKEVISPDPIVLESESTTVEVDGSEVTMTVSTVEQLDISQSVEPNSRQEAINKLEEATESAKEAIARIPVGSELEVAKQAIKETLVEQAQAVLDAEKKGCPFSKEDVKKITNAIVRAIARIESIRLNMQTWELQVTFRR
jgi:hypothetical protein